MSWGQPAQPSPPEAVVFYVDDSSSMRGFSHEKPPGDIDHFRDIVRFVEDYRQNTLKDASRFQRQDVDANLVAAVRKFADESVDTEEPGTLLVLLTDLWLHADERFDAGDALRDTLEKLVKENRTVGLLAVRSYYRGRIPLSGGIVKAVAKRTRQPARRPSPVPVPQAGTATVDLSFLAELVTKARMAISNTAYSDATSYLKKVVDEIAGLPAETPLSGTLRQTALSMLAELCEARAWQQACGIGRGSGRSREAARGSPTSPLWNDGVEFEGLRGLFAIFVGSRANVAHAVGALENSLQGSQLDSGAFDLKVFSTSSLKTPRGDGSLPVEVALEGDGTTSSRPAPLSLVDQGRIHKKIEQVEIPSGAHLLSLRLRTNDIVLPNSSLPGEVSVTPLYWLFSKDANQELCGERGGWRPVGDRSAQEPGKLKARAVGDSELTIGLPVRPAISNRTYLIRADIWLRVRAQEAMPESLRAWSMKKGDVVARVAALVDPVPEVEAESSSPEQFPTPELSTLYTRLTLAAWERATDYPIGEVLVAYRMQ